MIVSMQAARRINYVIRDVGRQADSLKNTCSFAAFCIVNGVVLCDTAIFSLSDHCKRYAHQAPS